MRKWRDEISNNCKSCGRWSKWEELKIKISMRERLERNNIDEEVRLMVPFIDDDDDCRMQNGSWVCSFFHSRHIAISENLRNLNNSGGDSGVMWKTIGEQGKKDMIHVLNGCPALARGWVTQLEVEEMERRHPCPERLGNKEVRSRE